jgi:hypothetical protein
VRWYLEKVDAMMFVLRRENEYDSDSFAARYTTPEIAARALVRIRALDVEPFSLIGGMFEPPIPTELPPDTMERAVAFCLSKRSEFNESKLKSALRQATDYTDTHPCLSDRFASFGVKKPFETWLVELQRDEPPGIRLLEPNAAKVFALMSQELLQHRDSWERFSEAFERATADLDRLQKKYEAGLTSVEEDLELIAYLLEMGERANARTKAVIDALAIKHPHESRIQKHQLLFELQRNQDRAAIPKIEAMARQEPSQEFELLASLYDYFEGQGDRLASERLRHRLLELQAEAEMLTEQMNSLNPSDDLEPLILEKDDFFRLRFALQSIKGIAAAYVLRKTLSHRYTSSCSQLLIVLDSKPFRMAPDAKSVVQELASKLELQNDIVINVIKMNPQWRARLESMPSAKIL